MKLISQLSVDLERASKKVIDNLIQAQEETAHKIWEDVIQKAPVGSGEYISSIQVSDTKQEGNTITTQIYTDLKSEDGYCIGRMIENGTGIYALEPHIGHTKTFIQSGYQYWFVPAKSVKEAIGKKITIGDSEFYIAKAQPSRPHFRPALNNNKEYYKSQIRKAVKEGMK